MQGSLHSEAYALRLKKAWNMVLKPTEFEMWLLHDENEENILVYFNDSIIFSKRKDCFT